MNLFSHRLIIIGVILVLLIGIGVVGYLAYSGEFSKKHTYIPPEAEIIPDEMIVKFMDGKSPTDPELNKELTDLGMVSYEQMHKDINDPELRKYYKLYFKPGTDIRKVQPILDKNRSVQNAEPNYKLEVFDTPNDPLYGQQWGYQKIMLDKARAISKGSTSITVAVIDSGIDFNHEDLPANVITGRDYITNLSRPQDDLGHGTHVAGTIAAATNNGIGVSGIVENSKLLIYKTCGGAGGTGCDLGDAMLAVTDAANKGAKVINMSLGGEGPNGCNNAPSLTDHLNYAINSKKVTVVAAAGNGGADKVGDDVSKTVPASCPGVIAVGNSTSNDSRASSSNYGPRVDIAAPGTGIYSVKLNGGYVNMSGTSMASPHVAGVAALLLAQNPNMTPDQVRKCLVDSGDPISTDKPIGNVRLNAYGALNGCKQVTEDSEPSVPTATPPSDPQVTLSGYTIQGMVYLDENNNREIDEGETGFQGATLNLIGTATRSIISGADGKFTFTGLSPGEYRLDQLYNNVTMNVYTFSLLNAVKVFTVDIPVPGDPNKEDDAGSPGGIIYPSPTPSPTPRPIPYYDCKEVTRNSPNNKTIHLKYLECTKSGEYIPKPQPT